MSATANDMIALAPSPARPGMSGPRLWWSWSRPDVWNLDGHTGAHIAEYEPFVADIAANTNTFGEPVLLLNGDSGLVAGR